MTSRTDKTIAHTRNFELAVSSPNPEGKGQVGFLLDWAYSSPHAVVAKPAPQLLADYFTSLLVLSSAFKFKPVFGKDYYLYIENERWVLSLISPDEWNDPAKRSAFVGTCMLHDDATWSIEPSGNIGKDCAVADQLANFYDGFIDKLNCGHVLEDGLPVYEAGLPYYQRLFASALSRSLKASLEKGGQTGLSADAWLERMPRNASRLLRSYSHTP